MPRKTKRTLEKLKDSKKPKLQKLNNAYILCPQKEILDKYYKITKRHHEMHINLHKEIILLNQIRKYILPLLMNGQIKIED